MLDLTSLYLLTYLKILSLGALCFYFKPQIQTEVLVLAFQV